MNDVPASELFRRVLQGTKLGITVQDATGRLVFANEAAATIIGFRTPEELTAALPGEILSRFEIFTLEGTPFPHEQLPGRAALQGRTTEEIPLRFKVRGTVEERWTLVRSVPVRDSSGNVILAINFFREITEEIRDREQRTFLLRAVDELNSSLDYEKTLSTVARLAVPVLADWCAIDLVDGDRTKRVAIAHVDPAKVALVEELERRYPSDPNARTGVPQILRSGAPEFVSDIPRELLIAAAVDEEHLRLIDELRLSSYLGVPLKVRGKTIGAISMAMAESGRRHTGKDVELAQALADRAALAIDNARLFREAEKTRALALAERDHSEASFRLMVASVKDYAIFMLDPSGHVATWNLGAQLINGYLAEEIIGQHFSRFYPEEDVGKCERELEIATREGRFEEEGWRVRKDGSRFWSSVVISAVRDEGRLVGFAKVTRDLTERKRTEKELAAETRRRTEAEVQSRFAEMFVGILGHDLRNPLSSVSMAAAYLERKGMDAEQSKIVSRIKTSTDRMGRMVDQLLDLTRTRIGGGIPVVPQRASLCELGRRIVDELRIAHPASNLQIEAAADVVGMWDPDRIAQVLSNLIGNAIDYSPADRPITIRILSDSGSARLYVHNEGPPIPKEFMTVMFDPYRRAGANGKQPRPSGLGLGLYITQQIVHAHGGRIHVRSAEGEGTTFEVILPLVSPRSN